MKNVPLHLIFLASFLTLFELHVQASPFGPLMKQLSSLLKWTMPSPKPAQTDGDFLLFENGFLVETVLVRGNKLGIEPYSIRVSPEGELFAVDAGNNNIVKITPPLSQYSRARLVAGSFQGYPGHVDGRPSDARFNHPQGVAVDDKGNVYVADTLNLAIRKIGEAGVTTIAGGKSNIAGYMDGPSEEAKFSTDFSVVYDRRTCSLLVIDRGNAALRQISLHPEDCVYQNSQISSSDIIMVVGAVLVGYASCMLQHGFGSSYSSKLKHTSEEEFQDQTTAEEPTFLMESLKEDTIAEWPSFRQLFTDLSKLALEALGGIFLYFIPLNLQFGKSKKGLTLIQDNLLMPEDKAAPPWVEKQSGPSPLTEILHTANASAEYNQQKHQKSKTATTKEPSLSSSKQQKPSECRSSEAPQHRQSVSKSHKDQIKQHCHG